MKPLLLLSALLLALACSGNETVDRAKWQAMSAEDRLLHVQELIGEAQVKEGAGRYDRPVNEYVKRIDEAYERGEARPVHELFAEMAEAR